MRLKPRLGIVTAIAIAALAAAGPVAAQGGARHGSHSDRNNHSGWAKGWSRWHRGHRFGHFVFGTFVSWTGTPTTPSSTSTGTSTARTGAKTAHHSRMNDDHPGPTTFSGTITLSVPAPPSTSGQAMQAHHATQSTQTMQVTYTFTNAVVFFGHGANPPAAGDRVALFVTGTRGRSDRGAGTTSGTGTATTTSPTSGTGTGTGTSPTSGTTTTKGTVRAILIRAPHTSSMS